MLHRLQAIAQDTGWEQLRYFVAAGLCPVVALLYGKTGNDVVILAAEFMIFDFVTGMLKGWNGPGISSSRAAAGIKRKALEALFISFGHLLDSHLGSGNVLKTTFANYICAIEAISIVENLGEVVPERFRKPLLALLSKQVDSLAGKVEAQVLAGDKPADPKEPADVSS